MRTPLQCTSHSHKPLNVHFRHAVEWCVQHEVNPGFAEKRHELYYMAWQELDDEVGGLTQSKFLSAAWKKEFIVALRARPETVVVRGKHPVAKDCAACSRSGCPANHRIKFLGSPYFKKFSNDRFLEPVEVASNSSEDDEDEDGDEDEVGSLGLKKETRFYAGSVAWRTRGPRICSYTGEWVF